MGVQCRISLFAANLASAEIAAQAAFHRIAEIDASVSDYRVDSDVALLARAADTREFVAIRSDTSRLLEHSQSVWHATSGAFDPTVGPVTRLWRKSRASRVMPAPDVLESARSLVDFSRVERSLPGSTQRCRLAPGMSLDFGAIAKGYAADEAVKVLASLGYPSSLVSLAGDIAAGDAPPSSRGWEIQINSGQGIEPEGTAFIANLCVSTSGDTEQVIEIQGVRYSHIIDPRLGWAISDRRSVTTFSPRGWEADGCATGLCVLGPAAAAQVCDARPELAAVFFVSDSHSVRRVTMGNLQTISHANITWR
jgi:thiamine biosynthesis lipoprotein